MTVDHLTMRPAPADSRRSPLRPAIVEIVASVVAVDASALILLNYLGAHLTLLGAPVRIDEQEVQHYWVLVAALAVAVLTSFGAAVRRRARRAFAWHLAVAVVGALVALTLPVTEAGLVKEEPPPSQLERPEQPGTPACHSGGDSDGCPGG